MYTRRMHGDKSMAIRLREVVMSLHIWITVSNLRVASTKNDQSQWWPQRYFGAGTQDVQGGAVRAVANQYIYIYILIYFKNTQSLKMNLVAVYKHLIRRQRCSQMVLRDA